ncbi:MAG: TIGR00725 family protein [Thermoplasmatota archaeon]
MYVSVIGGDVGSCSDKDRERAEELGKGIAEMNMILVCGGRGGVMEAACRGAKSAGGITIGILPSGNRSEGNDYLDHAIVTNLGMLRNSLVVLNGDVVVAIDGSYGTLSEISMATKYGKRILGLGTWDVDAVEECSSVKEVLGKLKKIKDENTKSL